MTNITNTTEKIKKIARFIADFDGFEDYSIIVMLNHPNLRTATRNKFEQAQFDEICDVICDYFSIDYSIVFMRTRIQPICNVRQIIWYFAKNVCGISESDIARLTGFDHSNVHHGIKKITDLISVDKKFSKQIDEIHELLK